MSTPKENKLINKTQSETFKRLTKLQNTKDIFEEPNIKKTKMNKIFRKRHDALTIKFDNDIINDNTENKEIVTQTDTTEEKSHINLKKYSYNSLTIFEDKKISKLRQKIHNELIPELDKKTIEKNQLLSSQDIIISDISKIKKELLELRNNLIEEKMTININERIKNQKITDNEIRKVWDLEINIEKKYNQLKKLEKNKKNKGKQIALILNKNKEKEDKINKIKSKLNEYDNKLNIPSAKPDSWFNKSDLKIKLEKNMASSNSRKEKEKISKKISQLEEEMIKIWNGKKVEKIYEEILPINNETYFIRTFQHIDNSIAEEVIYFQELTNGDIQVVNKTKKYENINDYTKDITLIEDISTIKDNLSFSKMPIKIFLSEQEKQKNWKINKSEIFVFILITIISIILLSLPVTLPLIITTLSTVVWEKALVSVVGLIIGQIANKWITNLVEDKTKKVQSWIKKKFHILISKIPGLKNFGKTKEEENIKNDIKKTIENLTSDKLETKLKTQYDILKQELNLNKNKNPNKLLENKRSLKTNNFKNNQILNNNSNNILENIDEINSTIIQPSTSTKVHNSNSI